MKQRTDLSKRDRSSVQPMMAEPDKVSAIGAELSKEEASGLHYDYSEIEEEAQKRLHSIVLEIRHHDRIASTNLLMIGKRLIEARELLPHGSFYRWGQEEFNYSEAMIRQVVAVAKRFADEPILSIGLTGTVMRLLATPIVANEEIAELKEKAEEEGRSVSVKEAEALRKRKREEKRRKEEEESSQPSDPNPEEIDITSSEYSVQETLKTTAITVSPESKEYSSGADESISELPSESLSESAPSKRLDLNAPEEIQARMRNLVNAFESIHFWPVLERMTLAEVIDAWHFAQKRKMERDLR
jgi:hypothetical protein